MQEAPPLHLRPYIRRHALMALFQIDQSGETDISRLTESFDAIESESEAKPLDNKWKELAVNTAVNAWQLREDADELITRLAPAWRPARQPAVDRSILRLAYYELLNNLAPKAVLINEAIEMAREFSSEKSPAFINGVLDQLAMRITPQDPGSGDKWLDDAMQSNSTEETE